MRQRRYSALLMCTEHLTKFTEMELYINLNCMAWESEGKCYTC